MTAATSSSPTRTAHQPSSEQVIVSPGDLVYTKAQKAASNLLRGPGVYEDGAGNYRASFSGRVRQVERLIIVESLSLQPLAVGDVVVGRVAAVGNGKWSVEVGQPRLASLPLQAIHLPNNEQRRRTAEDYLNMREFFQEEDLLLAEVQRVLPDSGEIFLQTRSAKYGRLGKGMLVVCNEEAGVWDWLGAGEAEGGGRSGVQLFEAEPEPRRAGKQVDAARAKEVVERDAEDSKKVVVERRSRKRSARREQAAGGGRRGQQPSGGRINLKQNFLYDKSILGGNRIVQLQLTRREEGKSPGEALDAAVPPIEAIFPANGWVFLRPCCTASGSKVETLNFSGRAAAGGSGDESSSAKTIQAILACRTAVADMLAQRQRLSVHALEQKGRDILKSML